MQQPAPAPPRQAPPRAAATPPRPPAPMAPGGGRQQLRRGAGGVLGGLLLLPLRLLQGSFQLAGTLLGCSAAVAMVAGDRVLPAACMRGVRGELAALQRGCAAAAFALHAPAPCARPREGSVPRPQPGVCSCLSSHTLGRRQPGSRRPCGSSSSSPPLPPPCHLSLADPGRPWQTRPPPRHATPRRHAAQHGAAGGAHRRPGAGAGVHPALQGRVWGPAPALCGAELGAGQRAGQHRVQVPLCLPALGRAPGGRGRGACCCCCRCRCCRR
jgi:hypothetical protein